uniref:HNH endonuclease n=1 Tax=Iridovirus LCIVAC01 TaxID=2506607 RepID=A0A481YQP5_9VIRU|nr:MAG: HNH endonuclease [Iridovirus LCIVAC01]
MNQEITFWMDIVGYPGYKISKDAKIYSLKMNKFLHIDYEYAKKYYKYPRLGLYNEGREKKEYLHVLVAKAYLPSINGKNTVNHKDGNIFNAHVDNLEWATKEEQVKHKLALKKPQKRNTPIVKITKDNKEVYYSSIQEAEQKENTRRTNIWRWISGNRNASDGSKWYFHKDYLCNNQEEEWKPVIINNEDIKYKVSSLGRIQNPKERFLRGSVKEGYIYISLYNGKRIDKALHRIVMEAFVGPIPDNMTVDHINRKRDDNRLCNLRYASKTEQYHNVSKETLSKRKPKSKIILQYTKDDKFIKEYSSVKEASLELFGHTRGTSNIQHVCRNEQVTAYGYKWRYK